MTDVDIVILSRGCPPLGSFHLMSSSFSRLQFSALEDTSVEGRHILLPDQVSNNIMIMILIILLILIIIFIIILLPDHVRNSKE